MKEVLKREEAQLVASTSQGIANLQNDILNLGSPFK